MTALPPTLHELTKDDRRDRTYGLEDAMDINNFLGSYGASFEKFTGVDFVDALENGLVLTVLKRAELLGFVMANGCNEQMMELVKTGGEPVDSEITQPTSGMAVPTSVPGSKGPNF